MTTARGPTAVLVVRTPDGEWFAIESVYEKDQHGELFATSTSTRLDAWTFEEAVMAYEVIHEGREDGRTLAWVRFDPRGKTARGVFRKIKDEEE